MASPTTIVRDWTRDLLLNRFAASPLVPRPLRWRILAGLGLDVAPCAVGPRGHYGGRRISIGKGAFLNYGVFLDNSAPIRIGERAQLGPEVMILTGTHSLGGRAARAGSPRAAAVTVGRGAWLGARVTVLPGVVIGDGCVIGTGAVVTADCEPDGVYTGVPARRVRSLSESE